MRAANTGELIGVEEKLAIAAEAAKAAISVRLKRRKKRKAAAKESAEPARKPSALVDVLTAKRVFEDVHGREWRVFAVHPSSATVERAALPESYIRGWLSFESGDEKRRIAPIPEGWEHLSIEDLRTLCQRAQRAQRAPKKRTSNPIPPPEASS
ncbi:MAG: hypothetical protein WD825_12995 [Gemmatimonadaceae bacterium]